MPEQQAVEPQEQQQQPATGEPPVTTGATPETVPPEAEESRNRGAGGWQRRVDRLTKRLSQSDQRFERLAGMFEQVLPHITGKTAAASSSSAADDSEPTADKFQTYEQWVKAQAKWEARQELKAHNERTQQAEARQAAEAETQRQSENMQAHHERLAAAFEQHEDFEELAAKVPANFPISPAAGRVIVESEDGVDILYYLCKHPTEAQKLSEMGDAAAVRYIERIAMKIGAELEEPSSEESEETEASESEKPKPVAVKPATPAPIRPVKKIAPTATGLSDDLSMDEWLRRRNAQLKKK